MGRMDGGGACLCSPLPLSSAALDELGLALSLQMGMVQGGVTLLSLEVKGDQADLSDAQVFDAGGRSWPTVLRRSHGGDEIGCQVLVPPSRSRRCSWRC